MTPDQLGQILARATAIDPRVEVNPMATEMWWETIGDLRFDHARDALVQHYRKGRERVYPSDIRGRVASARKARAEALPPNDVIMSDVKGTPGDWPQLLQRRRAAMLDDEMTLDEARAKYPPPPAPDAITAPDAADGDPR